MSLWSNPSLERSVSLINNVSSEIGYFARLSISPLEIPNNGHKEVIVFPGMEYYIRYYDTKLGAIKNIVGLVEDVYDKHSYVEPCFKIRYIQNESCTIECKSCNRNCSNKNSNKSIPICNCILNPPDSSKYKSPNVIYIPIKNIIDISANRENITPNRSFGNERGTKVMILGISATTLKSIVIHMEFFDDCIEKAVKYVDLEVCNIYDLSYISKRTNSVFETRGKLISIQECIGDPCKNGKGFVREIICPDNSIISNTCKKDFMEAPPVKKIKLTFDTSDDFSGNYEIITLDSIRNCSLVSEDDQLQNTIGGDVPTNVCTCPNCENNTCIPSEYVYPENDCSCNTNNQCYTIGDYKVVIDGDKVKVDNNGEKSDIEMSEILKFYFGE